MTQDFFNALDLHNPSIGSRKLHLLKEKLSFNSLAAAPSPLPGGWQGCANRDTIRLMQNRCESESALAEIEKIADLITNCFELQCEVHICGNGGSGWDAEHFAEEFTGRFRKDRKALPVIALLEEAHITSVANVFGY